MISYPKTQPFYSTIYKQWGLLLLEDCPFVDAKGKNHIIPKGYWYNAGSIPALFWQLTFDPFHPIMQIVALPHDYAYFSHCLSKSNADETLYNLLIKLRVNRVKAGMIKKAVQLFGESSYKMDPIDYVYLQHMKSEISKRGDDLTKYGLN